MKEYTNGRDMKYLLKNLKYRIIPHPKAPTFPKKVDGIDSDTLDSIEK